MHATAVEGEVRGRGGSVSCVAHRARQYVLAYYIGITCFIFVFAVLTCTKWLRELVDETLTRFAIFVANLLKVLFKVREKKYDLSTNLKICEAY